MGLEGRKSDMEGLGRFEAIGRASKADGEVCKGAGMTSGAAWKASAAAERGEGWDKRINVNVGTEVEVRWSDVKMKRSQMQWQEQRCGGLGLRWL